MPWCTRGFNNISTGNAANDSNEHLLRIGNEIEKATGVVFRTLNVVKRENCRHP